ncbi:glutathione peroxidase [Planococcus antarcticus DSM 14505]|uniref:Glutathione peroxidase n=1 Tax=Planococcus antarcticus DSM 14505 TaxID=1185653 RepID=A0A1C7DDR9_9BACL|nr:glutathione peroxidase [Planococcus antarcticus]ANU09552.1 glutathione peroxidase [Planococcus antarcticus DSM 14505]EIM08246.1 glutathione peroxidase [Planococcus antarcticus DSM 14505]
MNIYDITVTKPNGEDYQLSEYRGKAMLIVNTATKCGLRDQFNGLEKMYEDYKDQGLVVLGFPSNQFKQEEATGEEAQEACRMTYGITFPMHDLVKVNGEDAHPLFTYLTSNTKGFLTSGIKWNFTKFLIDQNGNIVSRFSPKDTPESFAKDVQKILAK